MKLPGKKIKLWQIGAALVLIVATAVALVLYLKSKPEKSAELPKPVVVETPKKIEPTVKQLSFAAMGDMLAHDSVVRQAATTDGYDFTPYFTDIKPLYSGSDAVFCNPETPAAGKAFGISGYPTFNAPVEFARDLSKVGCNLINMASNHTVDKGQAGLNATLDEWKKQSLLAITGGNRSAEEQQIVRYFTKNGLEVAFLAFADYSNGPIPHSYSINLYHDKALVQTLMRKARQNADIVIVSMHWGNENTHTPNSDQRQAARMMTDLGADVIIGTGPHMIQPVEWLKSDRGQTLVWYSIGNMLSSQLKTDELTGGVAKFTVALDNKKVAITNIEFKPTFMSYQWSASDRAAGRLEARTDLKLQPLAQAKSETALFGVSVQERRQKVVEWLGNKVELKID